MFILHEVATFISGTSNLICNALWLTLEISSLLGQALVRQISIVLDYVHQLCTLLNMLLQVLYEDSILFVQDVGETISNIIVFVLNGLTNLEESVLHLTSVFVPSINNSVDFLSDLMYKCVYALLTLVSFIKTFVCMIWEGLLLIGSSVWLAVTKIPLGVINFFVLCIEQIQNSLYGIVTFFVLMKRFILLGVQEIYHFICNISYSSVPSSILGMVILICALKNYRTIFRSVYYISDAVCVYLMSMFYKLWPGNVFQRGRPVVHINDESQNRVSEDKMCIACLDHIKEIIILPCRHVCLCLECSLHIMRNRRLCPICRSFIVTTMKVYI